MPPDASSRSRTYLPKIWGNTRPLHRTALLVVVLAAGCRTVPGPVRNHPIVAHALPRCGPPPSPPLTIDLSALGDFDPSGSTFESFDDPAVKDRPLLVPDSTAAVVLDAAAGPATFHGLGLVDPSGAIDVGLWPDGLACDLGDDSLGYPTTEGGEAVGVTADGRRLLVAGGAGTGAASALFVDLATGRAEAVTGNGGPRTARAGARATAFGDGILVSGGSAPDTGEAIGSADVFDARAVRFEANRIDLERPRAHHAAVMLASGETLLAGGVDAGGRGLRRLEVVSPETRQYRIEGLAELAAARVDPVALRLADGRVVVAGGTDPAAPDTPVETLEWLTADAASPDGTLTLDPPTRGRAFVAMPGGSVLVAGGCVPSGSDCTPSAQVFWITRDAVASEIAALDAPAGHPVLVPGSEGRPILIADGPIVDGKVTRILRVFDPFTGRFVEDDSVIAMPSNAARGFVRPDAGLFVFLDVESGHGVVRGVRHGTRNAFSVNVSPLISLDLDGVSLDRAPAGSFDEGTRSVRLDGGTRLVLTDTTYADVHLAVTTEGAAPVVHLGDAAYGAEDCPFPGADEASTTVRVDRTGGTVYLSRGSAVTECAGPDGRVPVWLDGGGRLPIVRSVRVRRASPP